MALLRNIGQLVRCLAEGGQGEVQPIEAGALVWQGETIVWVGREADLPVAFQEEPSIDVQGRLVLPGLIDCHTHLAFAGWRADEFRERSLGATYQDIARRGGGILSTVEATRRAGQEELLERAIGFAGEIARLGVTAIECKSGYGLDVETELKLLRTYRRLGQEVDLTVVSTYLGAHMVPPEWDRESYIDLVCQEMIPRIAEERLAAYCDIFVEEGAFRPEEAREIAQVAHRHGLGVKLHVDQLSDLGGGELAEEVGAISADHLEHLSSHGVAAMGRSGAVAVSLPFASLLLKQTSLPARKLIEAGVAVAVATDFNPGSAPTYHLPFAMALACMTQGMTPSEVVKGATLFAARAIGLEREVGSLEPGKRADFIVVDAPSCDHWLYHLRANCCLRRFRKGEESVFADTGSAACH